MKHERKLTQEVFFVYRMIPLVSRMYDFQPGKFGYDLLRIDSIIRLRQEHLFDQRPHTTFSLFVSIENWSMGRCSMPTVKVPAASEERNSVWEARQSITN